MQEIFHDDYYNHKKIQALYNYMIRTEYVYNKGKLTVNQTIKKYNIDENKIKKIFAEKLNQLRHKFDEDINVMVEKLYTFHTHKYEYLLPHISNLGELHIPTLVINITHLYEEVMSKFVVDEITGEEVLLKEYLDTPRLSIDKRQNKIKIATSAVLTNMFEEYSQEQREFLMLLYDWNSLGTMVNRMCIREI